MNTMNRRNKKIFVAALAVLCATGMGQGCPWVKSYGTRTHAGDIIAAPDGNFLIGGSEYVGNNGFYFSYLVKIKPNGDTIWTRTYSGSNGNQIMAHSAEAAADGNYLVAGTINTGTRDNDRAYLFKVKSDGDCIWAREYKQLDRYSYSVATASSKKGYTLVLGNKGDDDHHHLFVTSLHEVCFAYKGMHFSFIITVPGNSSNYGFSLLKAPAGMTISAGVRPVRAISRTGAGVGATPILVKQ